MEKEPTVEKDKSVRYLCIAGAAFVAVTVIAVIVVIVQLYHRQRAMDIMDEMAMATTLEAVQMKTPVSQAPAVSVPIEEDPLKDVPIPEKQVDIAAQQEEVNKDIYAWIYIPDSKIDYPVLQSATDNSYYLNYNIDGSKGYPGCIYTENYNAKDFSDPNTVLYGHNMKNGTMFAGLHQFEDVEYFDAHPYVYIYTEDGLLVYKIFAAYQSSDEHILLSNDFSSEESYRDYLTGVLETAGSDGNVDETVKVDTEDKIITLSTCISSKPHNRYLVQGVLLNGSQL